jgi:hypothetical protein
MIKLKYLLPIMFATLFTTSLLAEEVKKDCSLEKNLYKKMVCKTNNATSGITEKNTLADFFKKKK